MRSVPLPFLSKITLLWTRAREPGPVSPVKVDSPLPFPWTQRGEIYSIPVEKTDTLYFHILISGYVVTNCRYIFLDGLRLPASHFV